MRSAPFLAAAALASAAAFALQTPSTLHAASQPPTPSPDASFTWLEAELTANGGTLPSPFDPTATDWGLTSDVILALSLGGRGGAPAATTAATALATDIDDYITGNAFGDPGVYAGPVGKSLLVAELQGADANAFGGADLEALSRAAMETTGVQAGRFSDQGSLFGNFSNGLGQALNIMGLSYSDDGVPTDALAFLLDQQCPNGSFRLYYDDSDDATPLVRGCTDDAEGDTDATALALSALLAVTPSTDVRAAIDDASAWLLDVQDPTTHGFGGTGLTAAVNTNTTGLAAQALRAAGYTGEADLAAAYVASLELNPTNTAGSPAAEDVGAIAADQTTFDAALATGIPALGRDQWRRSTAQAVLALWPAGVRERTGHGRARAGPPARHPPRGVHDRRPPRRHRPGRRRNDPRTARRRARRGAARRRRRRAQRDGHRCHRHRIRHRVPVRRAPDGLERQLRRRHRVAQCGVRHAVADGHRVPVRRRSRHPTDRRRERVRPDRIRLRCARAGAPARHPARSAHRRRTAGRCRRRRRGDNARAPGRRARWRARRRRCRRAQRHGDRCHRHRVRDRVGLQHATADGVEHQLRRRQRRPERGDRQVVGRPARSARTSPRPAPN